MPRKPKPIPVPEVADPKKRFDTILTALLTVKKEELQRVEEKLKAVRQEKERRKKGLRK